MPEPITTSSSAAAYTTIGALGIFSMLPGVDAAVVLGAFSGAVVFVMSSKDMTWVVKLIHFFPAFFAGLLGAQETARLVSKLMPETLNVSNGLGAMVVSAVAVKMLRLLLDKKLDTLIPGESHD